MNKPKISNRINGYTYSWIDEKLTVDVSHLRVQNGKVECELLFSTDAPGINKLIKPEARYNIVSPNAQQNLIKELAKLTEEFDWQTVIGTLIHDVVSRARKGEPSHILFTDDVITPPEYLLYPLLLKKQPTVIYGEQGSGKSTLSIAIATCLEMPWIENPLGLDAPLMPVHCLILDWETEKNITAWQLKCFQKGMNLPPYSIAYYPCRMPLVEDIARIQELIAERDVEVIIVDSVGAACGGDLKEPDMALQFFNALRSLNVTTLLIGQTSKDTLSRKKTMFGSVFFEYMCRSIWELKKTQEYGNEDYDIGLWHRKSNYSKLFSPLGFHISRTDDATVISKEDVRDVAEFSEHLSNGQRILQTLRESPATIPQIAEELGIAQSVVKTTCYRLAERKQIVKSNNLWGLISNNE